MPPPPKFTKQRRPLPNRQSLSKPPSQSPDVPTMAFDQEKFEDELNWCVYQLKHTLSTQKLAEKKGMELVNGLGALQNPKVAVIKKRQIMRTLLGDYRDKMEHEKNKASSGGVAAKITKQQDAKKSKLLKTAAKRASLSTKPLSQCNFKMVPSGNLFRFGFQPSSEETTPAPPVVTSSVLAPPTLAPSNFRFNFVQGQENS